MTVQASEVEEAIQQGLSAYKSGDFSTAVSQLDYATLIRQERQVKLPPVFLSALAGWEAEEAESNSAGGGMMMEAGLPTELIAKGRRAFPIQLMMDSPCCNP